jgi:imidazolonepropionase-like amidohydrolase
VSAQRLVCAALALFAAAAPARAQDAKAVVIRGGRVLPIAGPAIDDGVVVIKDGRIAAVGGADTPVPEGADVVDAKGRIVMPGLVDGLTTLGLVEVDEVASTKDADEAVTPLTPQVIAADGVNVGSPVFRITRMNGTTTAVVAPDAGNVVAGRSSAIQLEGARLDAMLLAPVVAMHAAIGEPPMLRYGKKDQAPSTRMGEVAMLRAALVKAREYAAKWARYQDLKAHPKPPEPGKEAEPPEPPPVDLELDAWGAVLRREIPLVVRAQRLSDIQAALRVAKEFELRLVVQGGAEAWKVAADLAAANVAVLVGPVTTDPDTMETLGARADNAALLVAAGVKVAIVSADNHNARNLPYEAGIAVANGLPMDAALAAITLVPAQVLGLDARVGSLVPGKDADVILLDGDVIQPRTRVLRMWIRGREVQLTSRQTELADKWR